MNNEVSKEVPLREPLDAEKIGAEACREILAFADQRQPTAEEKHAINVIVTLGARFAEEIARTLPEGNERIIAINNIKSTVMWAKHGILSRSVEVSQA